MLKKLLLPIICILFPISMAGQKNQLPRLERAKMSIISILKNQKYDVQINAGLISFSDGLYTYSLDCTEESDELFFGKLFVTFDYNDVVTYDRVNKFSLNHNYKATKIVQSEDNYSVRSEFYFSDPDFIFESSGLFINTIRKAESMLVAKCQSDSEEIFVKIDSLTVNVKRDTIPPIIDGNINISTNKSCGDTVTVYVRIYCDNILTRKEMSPQNYSFINRLVIQDETHVYPLGEWELPDNYGPDSAIRYEIWDEQNSCLAIEEINQS
jgi:hypothetical protein